MFEEVDGSQFGVISGSLRNQMVPLSKSLAVHLRLVTNLLEPINLLTERTKNKQTIKSIPYRASFERFRVNSPRKTNYSHVTTRVNGRLKWSQKVRIRKLLDDKIPLCVSP